MIIKKQNAKKPLIIGALILLVLLTFGITKERLKLEGASVLDKALVYDWGIASVTGLYGVGNINQLGNTKSEVILSMLKMFPEKVLFRAPSIIYKKVTGFSDRPDIDRIDIDIKFRDYKTILDDRKKALEHYRLMEPNEVPAQIRYQGKTYKADIRLKGDLYDHWRSKTRMSLRINLKKKKMINGFNRFSIQKPGARQHPYDQVFQGFVSQTGELSSSHNYLRVFVNGENWGVMHAEEHMSKEFLEKRKSKESLIFKLIDGQKATYQTLEDNPYKGYRLSDRRLFTSVYRMNKNFENPLFRDYYSFVMDRFLKGEEASVVNVESFLKTGISTAMWNNKHTLDFNNARFYFNPYILQLEPITTDQGAFYPVSDDINPLKFLENEWLFQAALSQPEAKALLPKALASVSEASNAIPSLYEHYQSYFPNNAEIDFEMFFNNVEIVKKNADLENFGSPENRSAQSKQEPTEKQVNGLLDHVHIRHYDSGDLVLFNLLDVPVKIEKIYYKDKEVEFTSSVVPPYTENNGELKVKTDFTGNHDNRFKAHTSYKGIKRVTSSKATFSTDYYNPFDALYNQESPRFVKKIDEDKYRINYGTWFVSRPFLVNGDLEIAAGVKMIFAPDAYMIVRGALNAKGTDKLKIQMLPSEETWKGVYVLQAQKPSVLQHVVIANTTALQDGLLSLTGAVTFYKSPVTISDSKFLGTIAEDALNIVRSDFTLERSTLTTTRSDAFDCDFSDGKILNVNVDNVRGDGVDFSGSRVLIDGLDATNIHDKAISAGEGSDLIVKNSLANNVGVAIASKDGSRVEAEGISVVNYKLHAAMTYMKKPMFGPSYLTINNMSYDDSNAFSRQEGTTLIVDGQEVEEIDINVKKLYKSETMRK
ncbi:MAG: hypothetical protein HRT94_04480 [Alphaproteobacteria bacterium]|nr:hypothetical protein [Alphaproteobacteria bacterium]